MAADSQTPYIGRFAPSPTGPLHFGSLIAAVASYLQARIHDGRWLLRIEDIDPPREPAGSDSLILQGLEAYGFKWDGPVVYQSSFTPQHNARIDELLARGLAYPCRCSRRDLADAPRGALGSIYPGTCRDGCDATDVAIRVRTDDREISFVDGLQGLESQQLESESGDFVIKRRDGLIAYHLAVVSDDFDQDINEIVRGIDLLDSTPRQIYLQQLFGFAIPAYLHIPVAVDAAAVKLSKLTGASGISLSDPVPTLLNALQALQLPVDATLKRASIAEIWDWATENWDISRLTGLKSIAAPVGALE